MQLHCGAEHFSAEFGISNTFDDILTYSTYNVQCNTYILGPSFNLLFGSSELCLAGTHPPPDAVRWIFILLNRTEHESYSHATLRISSKGSCTICISQFWDISKMECVVPRLRCAQHRYVAASYRTEKGEGHSKIVRKEGHSFLLSCNCMAIIDSYILLT
jgi:hypothetical protein